jgi:hypothetical protein
VDTTTVFAGVVEGADMTRENLATASDRLEAAAEATTDDDAAERLRDLAGQLATFADRDRGPDHGRLARIENALGDLAETVGADATAEIEAAHGDVIAFRETIEGV